ncbi:hypothetical protein [Mycobacterium sp.]|nr:hypothetical protein [Mycobacterium sp.]
MIDDLIDKCGGRGNKAVELLPIGCRRGRITGSFVTRHSWPLWRKRQ